MQVVSDDAAAGPAARPTDAGAGSGQEGWVTYTICSRSSKIAGPACPDTMELAFPAGAISGEVCTLDH
jgi:hypothetical protein